MNDVQKESIRLLSEWNRWLVTVELAIVTALGFIVNETGSNFVGIFGSLAIFSFFASIVVSSFFLLNLSFAISEKTVQSDQRLIDVQVPFRAFWQRKKSVGWHREHYRIGQFTFLISRLFLVGLFFFSVTIGVKLYICAT